jgi:hypothetical protein
MAASEVSLANRALQILGVSQGIESLSQDHPNARTMTRVLEPRRQALLRKYRWTFAIKRASVAADGDQTLWGDLNRYGKPNDFLRLLRDGDVPNVREDWKIEELFIVTGDSSPLEFRYVADITDPTQWDALFFEVLAHDMANETCKEVTGSTAAKQDIKDDLKTLLSEAKLVGAMEEDPTEAVDDDWLRCNQ